MGKRSAEASIKGYMFQFLHSLKDILNSTEETLYTIEGIEDLDMKTLNFEYLVQYKYHELQDYKNSLVSKPIGLMFEHYLDNPDMYKYKLMIYLNSDLPEINKEILKTILCLKGAKKYISTDNIKYCYDEDKISGFLSNFSLEKTIKYSELENNIIENLKSIFSLSYNEAKMIYLPNSVNKIISLAMEKKIEHRRIKTCDFKDYLENTKFCIESSYIVRVYGEKYFAKQIKEKIRNDGNKKNNTDFVLFVDERSMEKLSQFIIQLVKQFFYRGNKSDFKVLTIIYKSPSDIKKSIAEEINRLNELIIFNDGYEEYCFSSKLFNSKAITTTMPKKGKVNEVNYNFRILSDKTFNENKESITFTNGVLFNLTAFDSDVEGYFNKTYNFSGLSTSTILDIIGGCRG